MKDNTRHEQFRHQVNGINLTDRFESEACASVIIANDVHDDEPEPYAYIGIRSGTLSVGCWLDPESMQTLRDDLTKAIRRHDRWAKGEAKRIAAEQPTGLV